MKTLAPLAFLAAFAAFVVLPFRFETGAAALLAGGIVSIVVCDYSRRYRPLPLPSAVAVPRRRERLPFAG